MLLKLMLAFVLTGVGISITIASLVSFWNNRVFDEYIVPGIAHHISLSTKLLNGKPDIARAVKFSQYMNLDTHIIGENFNWSFSGKPLQTSVINAPYSKVSASDHYPPIPEQLSYSEISEEEFSIRWQGEKFTFYFTNPKRPAPIAFKGFYISLLIALAIILCVFALFFWFTRRQFLPIKSIQTGIQKYAEGHLDERISLDRVDELGKLSHLINHMADEIQSMLEAKQQLLLAISHELRTPLTRAHISAAMLEDTPLKTDILGDLREMEKLVSDLLEGERLNKQHRALNLSVVSINDLTLEVAHYFQKSPINTKLLVEDLYIEVDPVRIQLMLKNLIANAVKYSDETEIIVSLSMINNELQIAVQDKGVGIDKEHLDKLTDPFYRADESRQRQSGGYGLGLYLCKLIMDAHKGELQIKSALNQGTTVIAKLPIPQ